MTALTKLIITALVFFDDVCLTRIVLFPLFYTTDLSITINRWVFNVFIDKDVIISCMSAKKSQAKTPLVSIITATYNDEVYIESSIRSVLSQDFTDFEYIIINDGSSDGTKKIIERLQKEDSRIRLINQKNSGLVASLNRGITEARGTYIARIDGDDEWLPHKLKTQAWSK